MNGMKYVILSLNIRADQEEERINEREDRNFEITHSEKGKRMKKVKKAYVIYRTASNKPMFNHWSLEEEREKWADSLFKEIMAENFLNLVIAINICTFYIGAPKYIKQILNDLKREIDNNTTIAGNFSSPLSAIDG